MTGSLGPSFDPDRIDAIRRRVAARGGSAIPVPAAASPRQSGSGTSFRQAGVITLGFVALLWALEIFDTILGGRLDRAGIEPRELSGLDGILFAPLLHGGFAHLISNTVAVLVLGFATLMTGITRGVLVTAVIWVVGGLGTWLTGQAHSIHLGASVLIFGWITYLIALGLFSRRIRELAVGVVVLLIYGGSVLWGVLPTDPRISWQGHLFGAIGGVLAAALVGKRARK